MKRRRASRSSDKATPSRSTETCLRIYKGSPECGAEDRRRPEDNRHAIFSTSEAAFTPRRPKAAFQPPPNALDHNRRRVLTLQRRDQTSSLTSRLLNIWLGPLQPMRARDAGRRVPRRSLSTWFFGSKVAALLSAGRPSETPAACERVRISCSFTFRVVLWTRSFRGGAGDPRRPPSLCSHCTSV